MSAFTQYTAQSVLNSTLRGTAFPVPTGIDVALFSELPAWLGDTTHELTDSGYARIDAAVGAAQSTGWTVADANGKSSNAKTLPFGQMLDIAEGATFTVPAFALFDRGTGEMLYRGSFETPVILQPNGSITLDPGALVIKLGDQ